MKTRVIAPAMDEKQAKAKLQLAVDHIAEVYTLIGAMTIKDLMDHPEFEGLFNLYKRAERKLEDLAEDDIPF